MPVKVIGHPIYRESNGLAMSSRNERLTDNERKEAALIYKTILKAKILFKTKSSATVTSFVIKTFEKNCTECVLPGQYIRSRHLIVFCVGH